MSQIKLAYCDIKACHIVPGTLKGNSMPTVICKFLYFADKNLIWTKKRKLRNVKNNISGLNIYINEPLPECEALIKQEASKRNFITSTHNCTVSVMVNDDKSDKTKFVRVNEIEDLDKLIPVKRKRPFENTFSANDRKMSDAKRSNNQAN